MFLCFRLHNQVIMENLDLTEQTCKMILDELTSFVISSRDLILLFCDIANNRHSCLHFFPNSCPMIFICKDCSNFCFWASESQNRNPELVSTFSRLQGLWLNTETQWDSFAFTWCTKRLLQEEQEGGRSILLIM